MTDISRIVLISPSLMLQAVAPLMRHRFIRSLLLSLPFVYVIFDLVENGAVLVLLANYSKRMDLLARSLACVTVAKRAASMFAIAIPVVLPAIRLLHSKFKNLAD